MNAKTSLSDQKVEIEKIFEIAGRLPPFAFKDFCEDLTPEDRLSLTSIT